MLVPIRAYLRTAPSRVLAGLAAALAAGLGAARGAGLAAGFGAARGAALAAGLAGAAANLSERLEGGIS